MIKLKSISKTYKVVEGIINALVLPLLILLVLLAVVTGCQKSADKRVKWTFDVGWPIDEIVVKDGLVYAKTPLNIFALDKITGNEKWRLKKRDLGKVWLGVQTLLVKDEAIYVAADASENAVFTNLYALDRVTGKKKRQLRIKSNGQIGSMFVDERFVYVSLGRGKGSFKVLDKKTFKPTWNFSTKDFIFFKDQFARDKNTLYLADGPNVYALNKENGKLKWKIASNNKKEGSNFPNLQLQRGVLIHSISDYIFRKTDGNSYVTDYDNRISAISSKTGQVKWSFKTISREREQALTISNNALYLERDGFINAFYIKTGKQLWRSSQKVEEVDSRIISDGRLYVWGKNLDIFDIKTGKLVRSEATPNQTVLLDALKSTIYSGRLGSPESGDNKNIIYSTNAKTGKEKWRLKLEWGYKNKGGEGYNISTPVISGDSLFFAASDLNEGGYGAGRLYSIKL